MEEDKATLKEYLGALHGPTDSVGNFSIDLTQAQGKIGGLQNRPGLYLLKLVQAAVAAGCDGVAIRLGRHQVKVQLHESPTHRWTRQEVEQVLQGPFHPQSSPALQHLAWALLLAQPYQRLQIEIEDGLYDSRCGWQAQTTPASGFALCLDRERSLLDWVSGLVASSKEHALLYERCCYAPIPVSLDGRWVNEPDRLDRLAPGGTVPCPKTFTLTWNYYCSEIIVERNLLERRGPRFLASLPTMRTGRYVRLGEQTVCAMENTLNFNLQGLRAPVTAVHLCQWMLDSPGPAWKLSRGQIPTPGQYPLVRARSVGGFSDVVESIEEARMAPYLSSVPAGLPSPWNREPGELMGGKTQNFERNLPLVKQRLTLPLGLKGPARLIPVLDGVALDPVVLQVPYPGLLAVATAPGLTTDLSQLKVVQDETLRTLTESISGNAEEMVSDLKAVLEPHYPDWVREHILARLP